MKNNYNSCFPRWIIENLKLALFPWYIYKEVKKYFQKRRQEKAEREPYKHLYLPKGEFERRFPQYKKSRRKHFKKTTIQQYSILSYISQTMTIGIVRFSIKYSLLLYCSCEGKWQRWRATTIGAIMNEVSSLNRKSVN